MQLIIKKSLIIYLVLFAYLFNIKLYSSEITSEDFGVISLMYHRFEENKYPSTNIRINEFKKHIDLINQENIKIINPSNFYNELKNNTNQRKILLTIDDGFLSFYEKAWPMLKKNKTPFILFVNTREVGSSGYMNWDQILELDKYEFVEIGNHSHSHEYLIDFSPKEIKMDLEKSISIFKKRLGKNSDFFSYPFGEYSLVFKKIVKDLGFKYAFGQHSGVIDLTKDIYEMPRFPINEKYGEINRFKTLLKTLPFQYKKIEPEEKYINEKTNPPNVVIEFYENIENLKNINCFSNEENKWRNSKIEFTSDTVLHIKIEGKFITERGRINCSLRNDDGFYRWLGIQFVVKEK